MWKKNHLSEDGEPPKIFNFSKFNPDRVTGNFELNAKGEPILKKDKKKKGTYIDNDGNRVNKKGYLIDKKGNVIDRRGNTVFKADALDKNGEIPKVFRNGLLRKGSDSELSRLMSEIEKDQGSDFEELLKNAEDQVDEEKGNTSVDSMMADTPSNYNIPNQRFDHDQIHKEPQHKYDEMEEDQFEQSDGWDGTGQKPKKKIVKRKKPKRK